MWSGILGKPAYWGAGTVESSPDDSTTLGPTPGTTYTVELEQDDVPSHWQNWKKQLLQVEMPYK